MNTQDNKLPNNKFKLLFSIIIVAVIGVLGVLLYCLKTSNSSTYNISVKEYDVTSGANEMELTLDKGNVVGVYTSDDEKERGAYVLNKNEEGQVAVTYRSFEDWDEEVPLYLSEHVALAYHTYQFEDNVLLLEMFYDESEQLKFELREIKAGAIGKGAHLVYQDTCERMPYVNIVELFQLENSRYTTSRVLLNYDDNGESKLLLLNEILSEFWVDHNRIVDSGIYFFGQEGTEYIETGKKICFAGGYGDSISMPIMIMQFFRNTIITSPFWIVGSLFHLKKREKNILSRVWNRA